MASNLCPTCHGCYKCGDCICSTTKSERQINLVNRVEVIDHTNSHSGRVFTKWEEGRFGYYCDIQDGGRTLKVFLLDTHADAD